MKKETKQGLICLLCAIQFALIAYYTSANETEDMIMPSVYIIDGLTNWYVILLGVLAEMIAAKFFLKETFLKTAVFALVVNLASLILDFVAVHLVSILVEVLFIPFGTATFHVSHWIAGLLLLVPVNACLEGLAARILFKLEFRKVFWWLCLANAVSMAVCLLFNMQWTAEMYF